MNDDELFLKDCIDSYLDRLKIVLFEKSRHQTAPWQLEPDENFDFDLNVNLNFSTSDFYLELQTTIDGEEPFIFGGEYDCGLGLCQGEVQ